MTTLSLTLDTRQTTAAFRRLREKTPIAIARALNRSADSGKTVMVRAMSQDLGIKVSDVRDTVGVSRARPDRHEAQLIATGARIPLIKLHARGPEPSRGKGRGVRWRLPGSRGHDPHAFIATMPSGHRGVFKRKARARLGIYELHGPSIPQVFTKFRAMGLARMTEQLVKNLRHELRFATLRDTSAA